MATEQAEGSVASPSSDGLDPEGPRGTDLGSGGEGGESESLMSPSEEEGAGPSDSLSGPWAL